MTTNEITDETRLTMLKHLAAGKTLDQVATITRHNREFVLDEVSKHGYPHSLAKGIDLLAAKIDRDRNTIPEGRPLPKTTPGAAPTPTPAAPRPATTSPSSVTSPDARPVGAPDEIRVLLNTGKTHTSKRIQKAADRVFDAIGHLRDLLAEDQEKNAARRAEEAQKAAARAEIQRLEKALADAKAKLRGGSKPVATTLDVDNSVSAAQLRAWAKTNGIDVPDRGPIPTDVREQYTAEHNGPGEAA